MSRLDGFKGKRYLPDMVRLPVKCFPPVSRLPEAESFHLRSVISHWRVAVDVALQIHIYQLLHIYPHNLIWIASMKQRAIARERLTSIDENDFVQVHREENIQEQDFVTEINRHQEDMRQYSRPDDSLLLGLSAEPMRPLVRNKLVLESVFLSHLGNKFLIVSPAHVTPLSAPRRSGTRSFPDIVSGYCKRYLTGSR